MNDTVAIVTGGGGGIGGAIAARLASQGAMVVVNDLGSDPEGNGTTSAQANATVQRIRSAGGNAEPDFSSVTDPTQCGSLVRKVIKRYGRLDILVNAAGNMRRGLLADCRLEDWQSVLDVHVGGHLNMIEPSLEAMANGKGGKIINVTSSSGLLHSPARSVAYATAKRAVAALTWHLGSHAPPGISVTAVAPIADTRMTSPSARLLGSQPGHALATPDDIAPVFSAIASASGPGLSGRVLFTNGRELSTIDAPRCLEYVDVGTDSELLWHICEQAARTNGSGGGSLIPRSGTPSGPEAAAKPDLRVAVLAEAPIDNVLHHGLRPYINTFIVPGPNVVTPFGTPDLAAALGPNSDIDAYVIATRSPRGEGSPFPDRATTLAQLATHATWARAVHTTPQGLSRRCSVWHVLVPPSGGLVQHEMVRNALSVLAVATAPEDSERARSYSISLADTCAASLSALGTLVTTLHCRDVDALLSGHPLTIASGRIGLWSKATISTTAMSTERWTEQEVLNALAVLDG